MEDCIWSTKFQRLDNMSCCRISLSYIQVSLLLPITRYFYFYHALIIAYVIVINALMILN